MIDNKKPFFNCGMIVAAICVTLLIGATQIPSLPAELYFWIPIVAVVGAGVLGLIGQMFNGE